MESSIADFFSFQLDLRFSIFLEKLPKFLFLEGKNEITVHPSGNIA